MATEHNLTADEAINRGRFREVRAALAGGRSCEGACRVHPTMTDGQLLTLDALEAILVDTRTLRADLTLWRGQIQESLHAMGATARKEVEHDGAIDEIMRRAGRATGGSNIAWLCALGISVCGVIMVYLWRAG
jgi:hypothetical protein